MELIISNLSIFFVVDQRSNHGVPFVVFFPPRMSSKESSLEEVISETKDLMKDSILDVVIEKSSGEEETAPPSKKRKHEDEDVVEYHVKVINKRKGTTLSSENFFIRDEDPLSYKYFIHHLRSICSKFASFKMERIAAPLNPPAEKVLVSFFSFPSNMVLLHQNILFPKKPLKISFFLYLIWQKRGEKGAQVSLEDLKARIDEIAPIQNDYYEVLIDTSTTSSGNFVRLGVRTIKYHRSLFNATLKIKTEEDFEKCEDWVSLISTVMIEEPTHDLDQEVLFDEVFDLVQRRSNVVLSDKFDCKSKVLINPKGETEMKLYVTYKGTSEFHSTITMWISTKMDMWKLEQMLDFVPDKIATLPPMPTM